MRPRPDDGLASPDVDTPPSMTGRPTTGPSTIGRRQLLRGGLAGIGATVLGGTVLAACSSSGDTVDEGVDPGPELSLMAMFPRDVAHIAAGHPTRLPFTLVDVEGVPLSDLEGPASFTVLFDGEQVGDPVQVGPRGDGVPRPYLPFEFEFPRPGLYDVEADYAGEVLTSQLQVFRPEEVRTPLVGAPLPSVNTPTTANSLEVDPICTRVPTCPFHEHDLADALTTDRPVVVLLASPAYCRTTACGPILELLVEHAADRDDLIVVHSEVYKNPKAVDDLADAALAPLPDQYVMPFEPCLFVTDASHTLVARGDVVVDREEMGEMLALAV